MEFQLEETASSPDKNPVLPRQRKFDKDEAVLARFGKHQQLRVSIALWPCLKVWQALLPSDNDSGKIEKLWTAAYCWSDKHLDDYLGSDYIVSIPNFHPVRRRFWLANPSASLRELVYGLSNGGPAGLVYGYLFVWCGASLQALVMAEMASMYVRHRIPSNSCLLIVAPMIRFPVAHPSHRRR